MIIGQIEIGQYTRIFCNCTFRSAVGANTTIAANTIVQSVLAAIVKEALTDADRLACLRFPPVPLPLPSPWAI